VALLYKVQETKVKKIIELFAKFLRRKVTRKKQASPLRMSRREGNPHQHLTNSFLLVNP